MFRVTGYLSFACLALAGCGEYTHYSQYGLDTARNTCNSQLLNDRARNTPDPVQNLSRCLAEKEMPQYLRMHPEKEADIRQLYGEMEALAVRIDRREIPYTEWNRYLKARHEALGLGRLPNCVKGSTKPCAVSDYYSYSAKQYMKHRNRDADEGSNKAKVSVP